MALTRARACCGEGTAGGVRNWIRVSMGSVCTGAAGDAASDAEVDASGTFLRHATKLVFARGRGLDDPEA